MNLVFLNIYHFFEGIDGCCNLEASALIQKGLRACQGSILQIVSVKKRVENKKKDSERTHNVIGWQGNFEPEERQVFRKWQREAESCLIVCSPILFANS